MSHPGMLHSARVVTSGQGKTISVGVVNHVFKITAEESRGAYAVMEVVLPPRLLVPPHVHTCEDELSIVLDGTLGVRVEDEDYALGVGSFIFKPRGIPHAVWNPGDAPNRCIEIISPGGLEHYFAELASVVKAGGAHDFVRMNRLDQKYGLGAVLDWMPELTIKYDVRPVGHSMQDL